MDKVRIEKLTNDVVEVANRYIDEHNMSTEDVFGGIVGAGFHVVKASVPAEAISGGPLQNIHKGSPLPKRLKEN